MDKEIKFEKVDVSIAVNANGYDSNKMKKDAKKRKIMTTAVAAISSAVLLTTATYAWFVLTNRPEVSQITMEAGTSGNLQIAKAKVDAQGNYSVDGSYSSSITFDDLAAGKKIALRPVASYNGQQFYEPKYTEDGYVTSVKSTAITQDTSTVNATENQGGQVIKKEFYLYAKSERSKGEKDNPRLVNIRLLGKYNAADGGSQPQGTSVENSTDGTNNGNGTGAYATRISFQCDVDESGNGVVVLEPNADYRSTSSIYSNSENNYAVPTDMINSETITGQYSPYVYDNDISDKKVTYKLFRQSKGGKFESEFVSFNGYNVNNQVDSNNFNKSYSPVLFRIPVNTNAKITMYIWLEGTDPECTNAIEADDITANFQFYSDDLEADIQSQSSESN